MKILIAIFSLVLALAFARLAFLKFVWILHMKMEEFNLFWQDYAPLVAWILLIICTMVGVIWYMFHN